jgi:3-hydroxyisobutyrate dehydrogenase-like beta-hydroxyacid dehydrogenase
VDANATSPATARQAAALVEQAGARFVDGSLVGPPPREPGSTRLYLSGAAAAEVAELCEGSRLEARVIGADPGAASALKMAYAGWTKGSAALLLSVRAMARAAGVEQALLDEWAQSIPELPDRSQRVASRIPAKAWRFEGEMDEIAATLRELGLPDGFHQAAAEAYRRIAPLRGREDDPDATFEALGRG